jgi:hypothetical protein
MMDDMKRSELMRALLACLASSAAAAFAAPAVAIDHAAFVGTHGVTIHGGFGDRRGDRHRRGNEGFFIYDRDYQGDTAWRSDSFNDWWHEQPERSYPRWMLNNQNCEKQWYQGDILRC